LSPTADAESTDRQPTSTASVTPDRGECRGDSGATMWYGQRDGPRRDGPELVGRCFVRSIPDQLCELEWNGERWTNPLVPAYPDKSKPKMSRVG